MIKFKEVDCIFQGIRQFVEMSEGISFQVVNKGAGFFEIRKGIDNAWLMVSHQRARSAHSALSNFLNAPADD